MRTLLVMVALGLGACSSFEREWRESLAPHLTRDPFAGAWEGRWTSSRHGPAANRFGGRLRCIFTPGNAGKYDAHFKANWHGFATTYHVLFRTERRGGELRFRGDYDLGPLAGGIYRYDGRVTRERFDSTYDSRYDAGRFEMNRPKPAAAR